jgi:hypothetical protein
VALTAIFGGIMLTQGFASFLTERHRLLIEYFDQNERFSSLLPRVGTVEKVLQFKDGIGPWFLVALDEPVNWEAVTYQRLLLMSRWDGYPIDGKELTSAFLLLVPPGVEPNPSNSYCVPPIATDVAYSRRARSRDD